MPLHAYWAYGLCLHSDVECPELPRHPLPHSPADISICLLAAVPHVTAGLEHGYFEVRPGVFRLAVEGVAQYTVEEGRRISIEPMAGAATEKVRLFLLGSAMGALLYQRGLFPLHGSAVETPWGAMVFVGAQGAGKSTLAAEFHRQGYRLLSDDVCAVQPTAEGFQILPALAQVRLCADAYERLGERVGARFDVDKFVVPMGEGYCREPVPLRAVHILSDHEDAIPRVDEVRGFERVQRLLENLYRPHYLKGQETEKMLMRLAGSIAGGTSLLSVARRRDAAAIGSLVGVLEREWSGRWDEAPAFALASAQEAV